MGLGLIKNDDPNWGDWVQPKPLIFTEISLRIKSWKFFLPSSLLHCIATAWKREGDEGVKLEYYETSWKGGRRCS